MAILDRDERQHLAGGGIGHQNVAAPRARVLEGLRERLMGDLLEVHVDGEADRPADRGLLDQHGLARNLPAVAVARGYLASGLAAQDLLVALLDSAGAGPVQHGAEEPARELTVRIEALELAIQMDSADPGEDLAHGRRIVSGHDGPFALRIGQLARIPRRERESGPERRHGRVAIGQLAGRDRHLHSLAREGQRDAVPIYDRPAGAGDLVTRVVLLLRDRPPLGALEHLELGGAAEDGETARQPYAKKDAATDRLRPLPPPLSLGLLHGASPGR